MMLKQSDQERDQLLAVAFMRIRVFCIHLIAFNNQELEVIYHTQIVKTVHTVTLGITRITTLTIN